MIDWVLAYSFRESFYSIGQDTNVIILFFLRYMYWKYYWQKYNFSNLANSIQLPRIPCCVLKARSSLKHPLEISLQGHEENILKVAFKNSKAKSPETVAHLFFFCFFFYFPEHTVSSFNIEYFLSRK